MSRIEQKYTELSEWQERLDYYKKVEPQIPKGSNEGFQNYKNINEAEKIITKLEDDIEQIKNKTEVNDKTITLKDVSEIDTMHQALDLFIQQKDKLDHRTTFKEFEEVENLKSELLDKLFGEYKQKINAIPVLQNKFVISLFETIMSSEKFSNATIDDIANIRKDLDNYKFYDRSVIVSAITLSVLNWRNFDPKKIDLLIDFLTDFEGDVWERALTGIILSTIIHQNRLQRHQLTKRLVELQKNEKIQIGIYIIDTILRNQLYVNVLFPDEFEKDKFLSQTPHNWFFPFYKDNLVIKEMLNKTEQDFEEESFVEFIHQVPFVSAYKYAICHGIMNNDIQISKKKFEENSELDLQKFNSLNIAYNLQPFYNLIAEYYLYYKFYPKDRVKAIFDRKITLAETKLKNIILSKVQALKLSADLNFEQEEYSACILKLKELLNIESNQLSALIQMTECYEEKHEYSEALTYHYEIEKIKPNIFANQFKIGFCLNRTKQFKKSNEYLFSADSLKDNKVEVLSLIGNNYLRLKNYNSSIEYNKRVLLVDENYEPSLQDLNLAYSNLKKPNIALKYSLRLFEIKPEDPDYLIKVAMDYSELGENIKSEELASKAFLLNSDDCEIAFGYGRILFINKDYKKSKIMLNKSLRMKDSKDLHGVIYGNLGHIALFENDNQKLVELYQKCVLEFDDIQLFEKKFDYDLPYVLENGISKTEYEEIKQEMIIYWQENN